MSSTYRVPFVNYPEQHRRLAAEINAAVQRTIYDGNLILREDVANFERDLAARVGTRYAVGLNSCTDALIFSLKAVGIGPGDEVITVAHTFLATIEAIIHAGATPVLVDVGDDYLMDMDAFEAAITPRTRAVIPVHLNGRVCEMDRCVAIAEAHNIVVIEDAAQALGATFDGQSAGSFGRASCFSFYPAKLLGAVGDGGAACTDDETLARAFRHLRDHGREGKDSHVLFGFTSRLDNFQAAILNVKLPHLDEWIAQRRQHAAHYDEGLRDVPGVTRPPGPDSRHKDVYQNYVIRSNARDELAGHLRQCGVEVLISNPTPVHKHRALGLTRFRLPVTERLATEVLSLPLIPELTEDQIAYVVETVRSFARA